MKVLHIGEYVNGGVATYIKTLLEGLAEKNVDNYLLLSQYKSGKTWNIENGKIFYYPYKRSISGLFRAGKIAQKYIEKINPDIIHVHSSWAGVFRIPYLWKKKRPKIIYTPHGWSFIMEIPKLKKYIYAVVERILTNITDRIITISQYEYNQGIKYGIDKNKMIMTYNGVSEANRNRAMPDLNVDLMKINLLFVGRIDKAKGLDIFLNYYREFDFKNIHLYVAGESVLEDCSLINSHNVTYLGWIDYEDIDSYYNLCDAVIVPSRWDGFGLSAIEAMRNCKAVIASNRAALPELILNQKNGYIFDLNDSLSLKNILEKLDKHSLSILGMNGYKRYKALFTSKIFCENTLKVYEEL